MWQRHAEQLPYLYFMVHMLYYTKLEWLEAWEIFDALGCKATGHPQLIINEHGKTLIKATFQLPTISR